MSQPMTRTWRGTATGPGTSRSSRRVSTSVTGFSWTSSGSCRPPPASRGWFRSSHLSPPLLFHRCLFVRQGRSRWTALLSNIRLSSRAPWEQKRRVVGMVRSPVEGHSIVMLKLDKDVVFSDLARPVCLPSTDSWMTGNDSVCVTLGWDNRQGQLKVSMHHPVFFSNIELLYTAQCPAFTL